MTKSGLMRQLISFLMRICLSLRAVFYDCVLIALLAKASSIPWLPSPLIAALVPFRLLHSAVFTMPGT